MSSKLIVPKGYDIVTKPTKGGGFIVTAVRRR